MPAAMDSVLQLVFLFFVVVLLTHDDIILVAFAVAEVDPAQRPKVIFAGITSSVLLRLMLASAAIVAASGLSGLGSPGSSPLQGLSALAGGSIIGLTLAIGILRLWRSWKVYRRLRQTPSVVYTQSLAWPILTVIASEFAAALEVVVFTAGISGGVWWVFLLGVLLSIVLKATASQLIAGLFARYPWIGWIGMLVVLWVAMNMIYEGSHEVTCLAYAFGCSESLWDAILHQLGPR